MENDKKAKAVECDALNGEGKAWAVVGGDGYTIYEAQFCEATAKALALLCHSMPKATWERHRQVLERMGCDLRDPAGYTQEVDHEVDQKADEA